VKAGASEHRTRSQQSKCFPETLRTIKKLDHQDFDSSSSRISPNASYIEGLGSMFFDRSIFGTKFLERITVSAVVAMYFVSFGEIL
jgi:hypothetical protein